MSSDATPISPEPQKRGTSTTLLIIIILAAGAVFFLFCAGVLTALLLPAVQAAREAARRNACTNNMRHIGIALANYHDQYGAFPPAYLADENGRPMHSWRVLILPYLERNDLYEAYDFDEPWDGPNNSRLAQQIPSAFRCPSATDSAPQTNYVAIVGDETGWPGADQIKYRQIIDGSSRTIQVVESADSGINWLEPRDLTFDEAVQGINPQRAGPGISSNHPGGVNAAFCDGHVQFLPNDTPPDALRALLTRSGREDVDALGF